MARRAVNQANNLYNESQNQYNTATSNAQGLYNQLVPTYTQEATNPQGFGKADLASMNTAAQQSAGGGVAAAEGKAGTEAAANRNLGSFAPALDEASRQATRTLGQEALGVQGENAQLKERQRQAGISGLSGLQEEQNADVLKSLGLGTEDVNAAVNAGKSGWFQNMLATIAALKPQGTYDSQSGNWSAGVGEG
jgi:hypothetical protein